jgi:hypothetical protein
MASTDAGTRAPADGDGPPDEPEASRGLRDRPLGRLLLLGIVLVAAVLVANTCASQDKDVTSEEAIELATAQASFEPCDEQGCVKVSFVQRGIPVVGYWAVGLRDSLEDAGGTKVEHFLVHVTTGDVSRP